MQEELAKRLKGRAEVYMVRDLIKDHFFGEGEPSDRFLDRVSNLVVLPYEGEGVYWYEAGPLRSAFPGPSRRPNSP